MFEQSIKYLSHVKGYALQKLRDRGLRSERTGRPVRNHNRTRRRNVAKTQRPSVRLRGNWKVRALMFVVTPSGKCHLHATTVNERTGEMSEGPVGPIFHRDLVSALQETLLALSN